ncbi:MAG: SUMF1/EgtB/PvdO family nonheme iron enzyme [Planctomycetes bacterium]|nr:SUMF1/EgtB/PvdO family nonheme iron enzyme [Planctomycetota bacterium]
MSDTPDTPHGDDPDETVRESDLDDPTELDTLVDEERTVVEERPQEIEDTGTMLSTAAARAREEPRAGAGVLVRVSDLDPWRSPLAGVSSLAPPGQERLRVGEFLREESGRHVHAATELDLDRAVELHLPGTGAPAAAVEAAARLYGRIAGAAVPVLYEVGRMPDGRPYILLSRPPGKPLADLVAKVQAGPAGASARRELVAALARVASAMHRAHQSRVVHLALDGDTVHVGRHGEVLVTGWGSPDALSASREGVSEDILALGRMVEAIACRKGRRRGSPVVHPGLPPELGAVVVRATARTASRRYRTAAELARELDRALSGEAVAAGRSPLGRRLLRFTRRHPYPVLVSSLVLAAGLVLAVILGLRARRQADLEAASRASERRARLERAARYLHETAEPLRQLNGALAKEGEAFAAVRDEHARATRPGLWGGPGAGAAPGDSASQDRRHEAELESRAALGAILELAGHSLEIVREMPSDPERDELERGATEVAVRSLLARVEADLALARFEEERDLSARTIPQAGRTEALRVVLAAALDGSSLDPEDMSSALSGVAEPWKKAALGLARLGELPGGGATSERARIVRALALFRPAARLVVRSVPEGLSASIRAVDVTGDAFVLGKPDETGSGEEADLPVGEYLLVLSDGAHEVRLPVLLSRGETFEWNPEWPGEFPAGDFVYVPAGVFRAGGGAPNAGAYRVERVEKGVFIAQREVSLGEYLEFLVSLRARGEEELLRDSLPLKEPGAYLVDTDLRIQEPAFLPEFPVTGISRKDAELFARWLTAASSGAWEYRLPEEAEWEFAARGASGRDYPWGDVWLPDRSTTGGSRGVGFLGVGSLPEGASLFGILHASGNAGEWTSGDFTGTLGVVRGGSGRETSELARTAARLPLDFRAKGIATGMRLVCTRGK